MRPKAEVDEIKVTVILTTVEGSRHVIDDHDGQICHFAKPPQNQTVLMGLCSMVMIWNENIVRTNAF